MSVVGDLFDTDLPRLKCDMVDLLQHDLCELESLPQRNCVNGREWEDMSQHRFVQSLAAVGALGMLVAAPAPAQTAPDNTKVNTRDRANGSVTADQQTNDKTDRDLTQQIRRALTQDKTLSTYAHNVKVVTRNGRVTLKGPVRSEEERKIVEAKATAVAGADHVADEMSIASERKSETTR